MTREFRTMDGNMAAAYVSYAFTQVAAVYPITPSSPMADYTDLWSVKGMKNIFGNKVRFIQMQSEAGAAGAFHGSLLAGALTTTYTSSQGLLLMIPDMYKVAGELLPGVINVAARTIATHALSIFGDHQDVYACRQTGFAMLASANVQEVMDLGAVAHLSAIEGRVPFMHFFDGFRTSHEIQKIQVWNYNELKDLCNMEAVKAFRKRSLNPERPVLKGSAQNPDIFFQIREGCNIYYDQIPTIVEKYMNQINDLAHTNYHLFDYYGVEDAVNVIVAMGSVCDTVEETIDYLNSHGAKTGLIKVRLYRPFSVDHFLRCIPDTVQIINVLNRTKEAGAVGEPLFLDVVAALKGSKFDKVRVLNGRYGISSKNTTPSQIMAVYRNASKLDYTIGIEDDVTHTSLKEYGSDQEIDTAPSGSYVCKFWGFGSDGTVGANKNSIKIIGDCTEKYVQAYFDYDSKKSGGLTLSYLRFAEEKIKSSYLPTRVDFAACHSQSYLGRYQIAEQIKPDGILLVNFGAGEKELSMQLGKETTAYIRRNRINVYAVDANSIAEEIGLGLRVNTILQAAFFKVTEIMDVDQAVREMKKRAENSYRKKGQEIVDMNCLAIDRGVQEVRKLDLSVIKDAQGEKDEGEAKGAEERNVQAEYRHKDVALFNKTTQMELPVSAFIQKIDGTYEQGTSKYEKRRISPSVVSWNPNGCIQCNRCAAVCPHGVIRSVVMNEEERRHAYEGMISTPMDMPGYVLNQMTDSQKGNYHFAITVSVEDCTGCAVCVKTCPGNKKNDVLSMKPLAEEEEKQKFFDYGMGLKEKRWLSRVYGENSIKGIQFNRPLLEFSGACAGCGETAYAKLITQVCGDRMVIANATGCSSIWAGSAPSSPYTTDEEGHGPAWANSLFEDNAEFGYGMKVATDTIKESLKNKLNLLAKRLEADTTKEEEGNEDEQLDLEHFDSEHSGAGCKQKVDSADQKVDQTKQKVHSEGQKANLVQAIQAYLEDGEKRENSEDLIRELKAYVEGALEGDRFDKCTAQDVCCVEKTEEVRMAEEILEYQEYLPEIVQWIFGGDGWAYDIGFGGLDHVLASGENVNVFVFDTEIYSNTGGQQSKSTNTGAVAQFAAAGKSIKKKNLAAIAMTYGYVYVAQVALGADMNQCVKAVQEAVRYQGPSLIIGYAPCISHGIRAGMVNSIEEELRAVKCGYWNLFRFDPDRKKAGENPLIVDSRAPSMDYKEFLMGENRYRSLTESDADRAEVLFAKAQKEAEDRYAGLMNMSGNGD